MTGRHAFLESAHRAAVAELAWRRPDGTLAATAAAPLVAETAVLFALSFDHTGLAKDVGAASAAVVVLSDSRMATKGWHPLAADVTVRVAADPEGSWAGTELLGQEVRKHPPSRRLIDTPIQRREHWWYLPRWLVRADAVHGTWPVGRRRGAGDGVLVVVRGSRLEADTVEVADWHADAVAVRSLSGRRIADAASCLLFSHDFSVPDFDRRTAMTVTGRLVDGRLAPTARDGSIGLPPPPRLWDRFQAHRRLGKACRQALKPYDRH